MLSGKNAIVTGARSGIGVATIKQFASNGANCWAVVHREDPDFLSKIHEWEQEYNVWIKPVYIDLRDPESIKTGVREIIREKLSVDILVNAAGIISPDRIFSMTSVMYH